MNMRRQAGEGNMDRHRTVRKPVQEGNHEEKHREKRMLPETYPESSQRNPGLRGVHIFSCPAKQACVMDTDIPAEPRA